MNHHSPRHRAVSLLHLATLLTPILLTLTHHAISAEPSSSTSPYPGLTCIGRLQPRSSQQIDASRWGVSCHWIADKHELSVDKQLDQLAWLGAKWAVVCPDWDRIEAQKGSYDFNSPAHRLDDVMRGLAARKIAPIVQIYGGNRLYMPFKPDPNDRALADASKLPDDPAIRQAWHRFIEALVRRYQPQAKVWEIWNEPNSEAFWMTKTSVQQYGQIVRQSVSVIRAVDPQAVILAGSTACVPVDYARDFLSTEGATSFDDWSVHPYGELPERWDADIQSVQQLIHRARPSAGLWQSECGFPSSGDTGGWGFGGPWNETTQAKWFLRRMFCDAALGMKGSIYFVLNDYAAQLEGGPRQGEMGVNRKGLFAARTWQPKAAAHTFRNLAALIDQRFTASPVPAAIELANSGSFGQARSEDIRTCTFRESSGAPLVAYWLAVPLQAKTTPAKANLTLKAPGLRHPVLVDLLDGRVYQPLCSVDPAGHVTFDGLPLTEFPLILCDRAAFDLATSQ